MKIAIIIERAEVVLGGAERSVFELARAVRARGAEVDVIAAKGQTNAKNIHILCQDFPGRRVDYVTFARAIRKYMAENQYDIVHSFLPFDFADIYQPRGGSYAESILRNAASYQNKLVESYKRLTAFANLRRTMLLRSEKKLCAKPDGPIVAALSEYVAQQFRSHYGLPDERITVIPNGIKINEQVSSAEADRLRGQILLKLGLKEADEPVLFLFVANNFRLKGLAPLIRAMAKASANKPSWPGFLVVAGSGKAHKYRHLAKKLRVGKRVVFLGHIRHIQNALSIVDAAVLPTFYDPASRFILEALAANKPVITSKFNGAADSFTDSRHGKVVDSPENVTALAQALDYFTSANNLQKTSEAIHADNIKDKISVSRVAQQLIPVYESILRKRRSL